MSKSFRLFWRQLLVIPVIIIIFNLPAEKRFLSLAANGVFWWIGLCTILYRGPLRWWISGLGFQFLTTAVIPVSILRWISWQHEFSTSQLYGISGKEWHSYSNVSYSFMLLGTLGLALWSKIQSKK